MFSHIVLHPNISIHSIQRELPSNTGEIIQSLLRMHHQAPENLSTKHSSTTANCDLIISKQIFLLLITEM